MSIIFDKLKTHAVNLEKIFNSVSFLVNNEKDLPWQNYSYTCASFRRATIDIIDRIETKKLWMMHLCVFPHTFDGAPIFGLDIVAGPNKVTGLFLDFSPIDLNHPFCSWYSNSVKDVEISKTRSLPEWAKNIFSEHIIAAGNISSEIELNKLIDLSKNLLIYYLNNLIHSRPPKSYDDLVKLYNYTEKQNYYCNQQKKNPHTPRVLKSIGFDQTTIKNFIENSLFPEIV